MYVCYVEMNTKFNIGFKVKSTDVNISKVVDYVNRVIGMEFVFAERLGSILNNKDKKCPKWTPIHDLEIKDSSLYDNHNRVYLSLYPEQFVCFHLCREYLDPSSGRDHPSIAWSSSPSAMRANPALDSGDQGQADQIRKKRNGYRKQLNPKIIWL